MLSPNETARRYGRATERASEMLGLHVDELKLCDIFRSKGFSWGKHEGVIYWHKSGAISEKEKKELSIPLDVLSRKHGVKWFTEYMSSGITLFSCQRFRKES